MLLSIFSFILLIELFLSADAQQIEPFGFVGLFVFGWLFLFRLCVFVSFALIC